MPRIYTSTGNWCSIVPRDFFFLHARPRHCTRDRDVWDQEARLLIISSLGASEGAWERTGVGVGLGDSRASYLYRAGPHRAPSHMLKLVVFAGGSALGIPKAKRQLPI